MKKYITIVVLILALLGPIFGCAAILGRFGEKALDLDEKTTGWIQKNRAEVCERAKKDPLILAGINKGIENKVLHPEICSLP